jgi:hypothetical protein
MPPSLRPSRRGRSAKPGDFFKISNTMIVMLGNWSGPAFRKIVVQRSNIGQMMSPVGWRHPQSPHWACDNDVFGNWQRGDAEWWKRDGERKWRGMLAKVMKEETRPMFVLLPDVVGDWRQTMIRVEKYICELAALRLPYAIALQNGCRFADVLPFKPDFVFVGGTTEWKWANVEPACRFFQPLGIRVHVGRTSGPLRIRECLRCGVDSCDGTGWGRASDAMLPSLWRELDGTDKQVRFEF